MHSAIVEKECYYPIKWNNWTKWTALKLEHCTLICGHTDYSAKDLSAVCKMQNVSECALVKQSILYNCLQLTAPQFYQNP